MEYSDTGVNKYAIGIPTSEERQQLIADGYIFASKGKTVQNEDGKTIEYEIWFK